MSDTQKIKDRLDLVQLIQEYIQLKKTGANYKANCPFHQEKTPSFMVHPERQIWRCFGCGKSGDAFDFVQEIEGMDFPESLRLLAERAGVKLDNYRRDINKSQKNRILEINQKAAYFFHKFLLEMPAAQKARDYLINRGITNQAITEWQIGYIPDQWDLLNQYLLKNGCSIDDIVASGLIIKKDNANPVTGRGYYDRFRGRIMFPICDIHDSVVGFTGRVLEETEHSGGKYVNTPQTLVFDKSRVIYGLNKARLEIKSQDKVVLVEGQADVVSAYQAGMKNVVAASGTALTIEQVKLLKRYSNNLAMAFDMDDAGIKAAKRGIDIAIEQGMNIKIIQIPQGCGKDADECIQKDKQVWFKAVKDASGVMKWYFDIYLKDIDLTSPKDKQSVAENILMEIVRLPSAIERDHWLKELGDEIRVDVNTLKEEMQRQFNLNKTKVTKYANQPIQKEPALQPQPPKDRYLIDLENILAIIFKFPERFKELNIRLKPEHFVDTSLSGLYEIVLEQYNTSNELDIVKIEGSLNKDHAERVNVLVLQGEQYYSELSEPEVEQEIGTILNRIDAGFKKRQIMSEIV